MNTVITKSYGDLPISEKEILRYAGAKEPTDAISELLNSALAEAKENLSYKVCYIESPICVSDGICDFSFFKIKSADLSKNLNECDKVIIFSATVGAGIDRLIAKYSRLSPAKAHMLGAIGAERIEALCDAFCDDLMEKYGEKLRPRFSIGYGDTSLTSQKEILNLLDASRKIGISLNESMLMTPTKSVTAFIGIKK